MCGIVGVASRKPIEDQQYLVSMRDTMVHRGPDDAGEWWNQDRTVGFGHTRLAIIDLSDTGHQPMSDQSGQFLIVYNGEIYNYQELRSELIKLGHFFRGESDTEVVLEAYKAWGIDCLHRLNGMFAFALCDSEKRQLFLARDRAGEKPLFFSRNSNGLMFGSELKALMAHPDLPRRLDVESLNFYLAYGYIPGDRCILKGVEKLPPAHAMTYDIGSNEVNIWRYWDLPDLSPQPDVPQNDLLERLESLLYDSVRRRLVADVPVGILLSGGLDSSIISALAAKASSYPLKTFTMTFPGHGHYDEGPHARQVADYFGTDHSELTVEPSIVEVLPNLALQFDEPIADSSIVPVYLLSRLVRQHVTVALGGDGGDELFGGYEHYSFIQRLERLRRLIPQSARYCVSKLSERLLPIGTRGRNHLIGFGADSARSIAHINVYFDALSRRCLLSPMAGNGSRASETPELHKAELCRADRSVFQNASTVDFLGIMAEAYLVKVDRASMLTSLEMRAPFLDHRLIEFAFGNIPDSMRATSHERKILLRRLAQRLLPADFNLTRKQGFSLPLDSWFSGAWGNYVKDVLSQADSHLFSQAMIQGLIAGQQRGRANSQRLFALTIFELWRRQYNVSL